MAQGRDARDQLQRGRCGGIVCRAAGVGEARDATAERWMLLPSMDAIGWRCDQNRARTRTETETVRCSGGVEKKRAVEPVPALCFWPHSREPKRDRRESAPQQIGIAVDGQPQAEGSEGPAKIDGRRPARAADG